MVNTSRGHTTMSRYPMAVIPLDQVRQPLHGYAAIRAVEFWAKVEIADCWEWRGGVTDGGYGRFSWAARPRLAHRIAWTLLVGQIVQGFELDHLCRNRRCVNPDHLEELSSSDHAHRSIKGLSPRCPRGHTTLVFQWSEGRGWRRRCSTCGSLNERSWLRERGGYERKHRIDAARRSAPGFRERKRAYDRERYLQRRAQGLPR